MTKKIIIATSIVAVFVFAWLPYENFPISTFETKRSTFATTTPTNVFGKSTIAITATEQKIPSSATTTILSISNHTGLKLYHNDQSGFELWYPDGWNTDGHKIFSTDRQRDFSGNIYGTEVVLQAPATCDYPACEKDFPRKNLSIQVFPANTDDTILMAISRVKGSGVSRLDIKPLAVGSMFFDYFNIYEYIVDVTGDDFDEPAFVRDGNLYIIGCDTITGKHMIFDECNMNTEELEHFLSTFKFLHQ